MNKDDIFVLSDTHINVLPAEKRNALFTFLNTTVARRAKMLFLNGDIIDLMAKTTSEMTVAALSQFDQVLKNLYSRGVEIHYILGNHDLPLQLLLPSFPKVINGFVEVHQQQQPVEIDPGVILHYRSMEFDFDTKKGYIEHGHIYDVGWVPGEIWMHAWEKAGKLELNQGWINNIYKLWEIFHCHGEDYQARILRTGSHLPAPIYASREASRIARKSGYNLVLFSHFHSPCLEELGDNQLFANPGDSLQHSNYIVISGDSVRLGDWRETLLEKV